MALRTITIIDRDYFAEMDEFIDNYLPDGDWIGSEVAMTLVAHLELHDPDLLTGWLRARSVPLLTEVIGTRRRARARLARLRAPKSSTGPFAAYEAHLREQAEGLSPGSLGGSPEPLSLFSQRLVVSPDNVARKIGDMTRADHLYVAERHEARARSALLEQAFHRAVADRIPEGGVTSDVFSEDTYRQLYESLRRL